MPALAARGACHLRRLEGLETCGVMSWVRWPRLLLPSATALRGGEYRGGRAEGIRAGVAGMGARLRQALGAAPFPGGYSPLRWVIQNPVCTTRRGHFPVSKGWRVRSGRTGLITSAVFTFS